MKPKKVYIVTIGSTVVFVTTNLKAAYEQLMHSVMYDDAKQFLSYPQVTRIINETGEFIHKGQYIVKYGIKRMALHTKHSKIGISG